MPEITALILDRPLCLECIAAKSGLTADQAEALLERIAAPWKLYREPARCRACGEIRRTYSVERLRY